MGSFSSKLLKHGCTDEVRETDESKNRIQIEDPRSPSGEIIRTPITVEDVKGSKENTFGSNLGTSLMRHNLLKNMKLDPRSPTDGISRTPIHLENTTYYKPSKGYNICESPISVYSQNYDLSSCSNIMTPSEPSVNVSGFDRDENDFDISSNFINETEKNITENIGAEEKLDTISKRALVVSNKPSTMEAKKILNEILQSKEFDEGFISKTERKYKKQPKNHSVHCDKEELKVNPRKKDKLKCRTPLSNITLSTNSPNYATSMRKPYTRCKILSDTGLENSDSPKVRQIAEWDKDKTVII